MFDLDDRSRRLLCRCGFVLFCLAPTVGVLVWCAAWRLPSHVRGIEQRLEQALDLSVAIRTVEHPRPGEMVIRDVEFFDRDSGLPLVDAAGLEIVRQGAALAIVARGAELDTAAIGPMWQRLRRLLSRADAIRLAEVRCVAGEVTVATPAAPLALRDVSATWRASETAAQAELRFAVGDDVVSEPVALRVMRRLEPATRPTTTIELHTAGAALPSALWTLDDAPHRLGPDCHFSGSVWASESGGSWETDVTGRLEPIDLDHAVTMHFPHKLSGTARLRIKQARFRDGRLEEASGELMAGPGVVSRSLLVSAAQSLELAWHLAADVQGLVPYDEMAAGFAIDSRGVLIEGICSHSPAGALVVDRERVLLGQPTSVQPVTALVRTLVPHGQAQVPATWETEWLITRLPLARVVAPRNDAPPPGMDRAPTRRR